MQSPSAASPQQVCVCVNVCVCVCVCVPVCVCARNRPGTRVCIVLLLVIPQASDATVTIDAIRAAFTALNISGLANASVGFMLDQGYEEIVPVSNLVKLLRDSGLDPSTALDVKKAALKNPTLTLELVRLCFGRL